MAPADLIAYKVYSYHQRRGHPKSGTDWRDAAMLLLAFPEMRREAGPVARGWKRSAVIQSFSPFGGNSSIRR